MSKILIFRHGETDYNVEKRLQGFLDIPLNERGKRQAKELSEKLKAEKIDLMYSSPLSRALDTAKEILKGHPETELVLEKSLQERDFGKYAGTLKAELPEKFPELKGAELINTWKSVDGRVESYAEIRERVFPLLEKISEKARKENINIALSTHKGPIRLARMFFEKKTEEEVLDMHMAKNCQLWEYEV